MAQNSQRWQLQALLDTHTPTCTFWTLEYTATMTCRNRPNFEDYWGEIIRVCVSILPTTLPPSPLLNPLTYVSGPTESLKGMVRDFTYWLCPTIWKMVYWHFPLVWYSVWDSVHAGFLLAWFPGLSQVWMRKFQLPPQGQFAHLYTQGPVYQCHNAWLNTPLRVQVFIGTQLF